ncbi:phosphodiester glycosidase family protein [Streptococcaceae bacterium ESL0729]|nr:phosphodiester glycosidase family protein [Streptococcaceae bacterium ESL0729]
MERHNRRKRRGSWIFILVLLIILLLIGGGAYALRDLFLPQREEATTSLSSNQPTKTSEENGYVPEEKAPAATGSMEVTEDTGEAGWVKVPSSEKLDKFTDLSVNNITIYRINNPEVLKTVTNLSDQRVTMDELVAKYPNSLIMNASGFNMETGVIAGFQINNGELIRDWRSTDSLQYAFVINKDGSCKIYDSRTPASEIIANGGQQSYDFGSAVIRDGLVQPSDGSVDWKIHTFIANDKKNNLYAILSDTNAGYGNIMNAVSNLGLENMLLLDGGGSSQLSVNGQVIVASQDSRPVPDYIVMK